MPRLLRSACTLVLIAVAAVVLGRWPAAKDALSLPAARADETPAAAPAFPVESVAYFEQKVRPLLEARCFECHGPAAKKLQGGLRLDSRAAALKGGDSGPAIVPGKPAESVLIDAIHYRTFEMPPRSKLPEGEIAILTRWVELGAPWSKGGDAPLVKEEKFPLEKRKAAHWAWQPIRTVAPPAVAAKHAGWAYNDIDRFLLATLEEKGLAPAPDADRRTLLRRAHFAIVGLPPSPAEVDDFVNDPAPTRHAFEKAVDRLLDSPHFGERWGRHWLDLVRYAETLGHEFDYPLHYAPQYRDYVIRAFNADVPYDQLVREHIAGDLLPNPRRHPTEGYNESLIGTGFWYLGEDKHAPVDARGEEAALIDNRIDVFSKTFLGLTVACARCHDHKFDAISTRDYYALFGFLKSSRRQVGLLDPHGTIAARAAELRLLQEKAAGFLHDLMLDPDEGTADEFARYLMASRDVMFGEPLEEDAQDPNAAAPFKRPISIVAVQHDVDPKRLRAWVDALRDDSIRHPSHPMSAWAALAVVSDPARFVEKRQEWASRVRAEWERTDADMPVFEHFFDSYRNWFATGEAFGAAPTSAVAWDPRSGDGRLHPFGVAHSGLLSPKLCGVLRSRTFVLSHPRILYRAAGKNARIRLVIDGYQMNEFNGLLFNGATIKIDNEQFAWHTQAGDVSRYQGHRCYIELIDDGDGWLAVDEIRFAKDGARPEVRPGVALRLAEDKTVISLKELARAYGQEWRSSVAAWREAGDLWRSTLVAWAIEHKLVPTRDYSEKLKKLTEEMRSVSETIPPPMRVVAIADGDGEDERVFIRGSHKNLGGVVPRRMLEAISGSDQPPIAQGSGRLELAERLLDPSNPFPPRVMANRVWHHLFGRGIVASVDNFGVLGEEPTHPELLDWLAAEFRGSGNGGRRSEKSGGSRGNGGKTSERTSPISRGPEGRANGERSTSGEPVPSTSDRDPAGRASSSPDSRPPTPDPRPWSIKHLIRTIVLSHAWQMASELTSAAEEADPQNLLLHRQNIRRLEGEAIRDSLLAISGRLDRTVYGPSVPVHLTPFMQGRGRPAGGPLDGNGRRSVYTSVNRNFLSPMMLAFDTPIPFTTIGRRNVSNVPAQALILMNDPFVVEQTRLWARRTLALGDATPEERIDRLYRDAFARRPTDAERSEAMAFLKSLAAGYGLAAQGWEKDDRPWADLCHVLVNVKEFIYLH